MDVNNNQWATIALVTAALMLVFLIYVFYGNKKADEQLPPVAPTEQVTAPAAPKPQ